MVPTDAVARIEGATLGHQVTLTPHWIRDALADPITGPPASKKSRRLDTMPSLIEGTDHDFLEIGL